ncbi:excisionase family DNA-binding protein [Corynebacterium suicordis]
MATTTSNAAVWLSVADAAEYMGASQKTVRRLIANSKLQATYFTPRTLRVNRESIDQLASDNLAGAWAVK